MKLCVNVLCASRPDYLYITLDGIFRNTVVPDVYVYIDVLLDGIDRNKEMMEVISNFKVRGIFINETHRGIGQQFWYSFNKAFELGYDYCIHIEEDWLITTDAIQWFCECPKNAFMYSLYRWTERMGVNLEGENATLKNGENLSWCIIFSKESFDFVYRIIKSKAYYGLFDHDITKQHIDSMDNYDWDIPLTAIAKHYRLTQIVPPESRLAHFGSKSCFIGIGYGNLSERHNEMLVGDRNQWVGNVARMFEELTEQERKDISFAPTIFHYR